MTRLIQFYLRHRKLCLILVSIAVATAVITIPHIAFAQDKDPDTTKLLNQINTIFDMLIKLSAAWMWPILLMIGSLLDNDLVFGGAMGERLLGVWVQVRNLVNIVFVLVLLAIAVYNVLGLGEEGGSLPLAFKTVMPKFILALIAVNFSFLAVKVVLDFTNVVTGAVFALPTTAVSQKVDIKDTFAQVVCGTNSSEVSLKPSYCKGTELNDRAKQFFSRLDRSNITLAYAIRFGRAPQLKFIRDGIKGISQLGFNIIFNAVLYVAYAASFIALFLVLLFRLVAVWIAVVLSPLLALSIVLPNLKELAGGAGELQQKFVKSAIAPVTIGLVLSVGYIMLDGFDADKSIHGSLLASNTLDAIDPNALPTDIGDLQQLMIAVGVIVIVWTGVFGAAKDTIAGGATEFIKGNLEGFGKWVSKLPTYLQVIPTSGKFRDKFGKDRMSLASLFSTVKEIPSISEQKWGSSLFHPQLSQADLEPWRVAAQNTSSGQYERLIEALKQKPQTLSSPAGRDYLYEALQKAGLAQDKKAARDLVGENPADIARNLLDSNKTRGLAVKLRETYTENTLKNAIEHSGETAAKKIANDADLVQALKGGDESPAQLAARPEVKAIKIDEQFIKNYISLPSSVQDTIMIKYGSPVSSDDKEDVTNLAALNNDLKNAKAKLAGLDDRLKKIHKSSARQKLYDSLSTASADVINDPAWTKHGVKTKTS